MLRDSPLYIFNPDTEIALASGLDSFTPRKAVLNFERELGLLPALYAEEGSAIWLPYCRAREEVSTLPYHEVAEARGIKVMTREEIKGYTGEIRPWGWNRALARMLVNAGYTGRHIPSAAMLGYIRELASRRTAVNAWSRMAALPAFSEISMADLCPRSFHDHTEALDFAAAWGEGCVVKSPWSSSGRGVFFSSGKSAYMTARRIEETLHAQGHVIIEPLWRKRMDFASEWEARDGKVRFLGFSLFATDEAGHYAGNYVASQKSLLNRITEFTEGKALWQSIELLGSTLQTVIADRYSGPLGVDMLVDDAGRINPCVEINLRNTMGHIALSLHSLTRSEFLFIPGQKVPFPAEYDKDKPHRMLGI